MGRSPISRLPPRAKCNPRSSPWLGPTIPLRISRAAMGGVGRRIFAVSLGTVALCVVLVVALWYQHHQFQQHLHEQRDEAMLAIEAGRYAEARAVLERYLYHTGVEDGEAMAGLGRAIVADATASRADRVHAMRLFKRVAALDPDDLTARQQLLSLQRAFGFDEALVRTADQILALTDDADRVRAVRRAKAEALLRLERYVAALAVVGAMVRDDPDALTAYRLTLEVVSEGPWSPSQVIDYAQALREAHPDDVRFDVLLGVAHRLIDRVPEAAAVLRRCVDRPLPDSATARLLARELERVERFEDALRVLERGAKAFDERTLDAALIARLWQRGRDGEVLARFGALAEGSGAAAPDALPTELVALKAMTLMRLDRHADAEPWLDVLRGRTLGDGEAAAWTIYLTGVFEQPLEPTIVIRRCRRALLRDSSNAYIQFELGRALAAEGERRLAVAHWRKAAAAQPAWAAPRLQAAQALTELGLPTQAVAMARDAHRRSEPKDVAARVALAEARWLNLGRGGADSPAALLEWVEAIHRDQPYEPRTLAIYLELLAEVGQRERAGEMMLAALDHALPQRTLLALARVSRTHGLGLAEACYAQCETLHGRTPELAHARAIDHWKRGRAERALAALRPPAERELDGPTARAWALARVRFEDETQDESRQEAVRRQWAQVLRQYPDSTAVHRAALESEVVWADRRLAQRTIDRLRALSDEQAIAWRLATARWRLEAEHVTTATAADVALLLAPVRRQAPRLVEPRLWLGRAFAHMDEPAVAIAQLRAASEYAPHHQTVLLELAKLLIEREQATEALAMLSRVVDHPASTAPQLQRAAAMLVRLRGWDAAVTALTRAAEAGGRTPDDLLMAGFAEEVIGGADAERTERD